MRFPFSFLALAICCVASSAVVASDKLGSPSETVRFDGQRLLLTSQKSDSGERLKEYTLDGEKGNAWTKFASIRESAKSGEDPKTAAANQLRSVKQQNPLAASSTIQNPKTGEVIVDFVTWNAGNTMAEFNIYKYSKTASGGLVTQRYALREYKDVSGFLKGLKLVRERLVGLMAKEGLQAGD